jgi:NhaP-type Na+/H+ and K+/H+ antiporter
LVAVPLDVLVVRVTEPDASAHAAGGVCVIGTGLDLVNVVFIGWFGPRGLASIVLGLVYLKEELNLAGESTIRSAVMVTVLLSIFVHGLSARAGVGLYAQRV